LKAELKRLKLKLFYPVNEDAEPGTIEYRKNLQRINANFEVCDRRLAMVDVGDEPGDDRGDTIRVGWIKVNENFGQIEKAMGENHDKS
jgi:hypothetical protein